ncbi:MAG: DUF4357 domain-containing protein [Candidatus Cloacimonadaceae bacterium]|nr:DUF4357 domain-containing protein [Candidatus Cloacimonadaceae bacterium]
MEPCKFHTEYKVEKVPTESLPKGSTGRVDIALFLADKTPKVGEVFIEVKSPGNLMKSAIKHSEDQLNAYIAHHRIAIGILTDGIIWRFYVPHRGGYFQDTLFAEFNLESANIDEVCAFFDSILKKENFRTKAVNRAEAMFEELTTIKLIQSVKNEAQTIQRRIGGSVFSIAEQLLINQHQKTIAIELIERIWNKTIPGGDDDEPPQPPPPPPPDCIKVHISNKDVKASGEYFQITKQFTLLKGSEVIKDHKSSFKGPSLQHKLDMIKEGALYLDSTGTKYILRDNYNFKSPSAASHLVTGRSSNGWLDWLDEHGKKLDDYRK